MRGIMTNPLSRHGSQNKYNGLASDSDYVLRDEASSSIPAENSSNGVADTVIVLPENSSADFSAPTIERIRADSAATPSRKWVKPLRLRSKFHHRKAVEEYCLWTMCLYAGVGSIFLVCMIIAYFEGWGFLDGVYFGAVTLTTVGYGDLTPRTDTTKVLTCGLIASSVVLFSIVFARTQHAIVVRVAARASSSSGSSGSSGNGRRSSSRASIAALGTPKGRLVAAAALLVVVGSSAAVSFLFLEGDWSGVDALYFVVVTAATVGFGDVTPRTRGGKVLAALLVVIGPWLLGRAIAAFVELSADSMHALDDAKDARDIRRAAALAAAERIEALSMEDPRVSSHNGCSGSSSNGSSSRSGSSSNSNPSGFINGFEGHSSQHRGDAFDVALESSHASEERHSEASAFATPSSTSAPPPPPVSSYSTTSSDSFEGTQQHEELRAWATSAAHLCSAEGCTDALPADFCVGFLLAAGAVDDADVARAAAAWSDSRRRPPLSHVAGHHSRGAMAPPPSSSSSSSSSLPTTPPGPPRRSNSFSAAPLLPTHRSQGDVGPFSDLAQGHGGSDDEHDDDGSAGNNDGGIGLTPTVREAALEAATMASADSNNPLRRGGGEGAIGGSTCSTSSSQARRSSSSGSSSGSGPYGPAWRLQVMSAGKAGLQRAVRQAQRQQKLRRVQWRAVAKKQLRDQQKREEEEEGGL